MPRRIVVTQYVSLDGVMQDPAGSEGSGLGAWISGFQRGPEGEAVKHEELFASDTLLFGRVTYEGFAAVWPSVEDKTGFAKKINSLPKVVVSTTLTEANWGVSTIVRSDVPDAIATLKAKPGGDILIYGSRTLVQTLMEHGLVDAYNLMIYPIVLGRGARLFGDVRGTRLQLTESKTLGSGIMWQRYETAPAV